MKANEIRSRFVKFFEKNGHHHYPSSSLVPHNDPTLLFANAGMNQFKDYFTGVAKPQHPRAVTVQKCVRAGGKHNDLENVGFTARHHTFFEMLGNFSFGNYFKTDAISLAWQFLTEELKIPKDKLYITCHTSDQEAADIWHQNHGIERSRIFFMGDKDNFWEMGDTGPCGPCSEIFYDHGPAFSDGSDTSQCLLHDEGRYVEIWNLVFMQFEKLKNPDGTIERRSLPKPSVDTGAGLERLSAAMQNVYWNYDSDLFSNIIRKIEEISGKKYQDNKWKSHFRVVADHARSAVMLITDGVIPSNEGRGYVLRRIIRRAIRHLNSLEIKEVKFFELVTVVLNDFKNIYPENFSNHDLATHHLKSEEQKFRLTLQSGLKILEDEMSRLDNGKELNAEIAFKLYDTHGFPIDLTEVILKENQKHLNHEKFNSLLLEQKERSKKSSNFSSNVDHSKFFNSLRERSTQSEFIGYDLVKAESKVLHCSELDNRIILITDKTPFYPEGGGQSGDTGIVTILENEETIEIADIINTTKPVPGLIVHWLQVKDGLNSPTVINQLQNKTVGLVIDKVSRNASKRNHTATHLLQSALIRVLGPHIKQAGSSVTPDRLRLDFTHHQAVKADELKTISHLVNDQIYANIATQNFVTTKEKALELGALAFFGEKYEDTVRVMKVDDFSIELCGGTHVHNTSEIGLFVIIQETAVASGVRRIEALTGKSAYQYLDQRNVLLDKIEKFTNANEDKVLSFLQNQKEESREMQKQINSFKEKFFLHEFSTDIKKSRSLENGKTFITFLVNGADGKELKIYSDLIVNNFSNVILILASQSIDKFNFILRTTKSVEGLDCREIINKLKEKHSITGGGKSDSIQGALNSTNLESYHSMIKDLEKLLN